MTDFKWRIWAKIVAIIDLVFVCLPLLGLLLIIFITTVANNNKKGGQGIGAWTGLMWLGVVIVLFQTAVGLWAALQLFQATKLGQRPEDAYQLSQNWQTICVLFMLFSVISGITVNSVMLPLVSVSIRIIFLCIVFCFMREVDRAINATRRLTTERI